MILHLLVLVTAVSAADKCNQAREKANAPMLIGSYIPQCKSDGNYEELQCHGSTGYCWCVDANTGHELPGTKAQGFSNKEFCKKKCVIERSSRNALAMAGLLGIPTPECDEKGDYLAMQCHLSSCWCVNPKTGKAVENTSKYLKDSVETMC